MPTLPKNLIKFLAESKVQDRLYHGTTKSEKGKGEQAFKSLKSSKEGALGSGVYLTPNPAFASSYAEEMGGNVLPLYAQIKNPLILRGSGTPDKYKDPMIEALELLGVDPKKASSMVEKAYDQKGYIGKEVQSRAQNLGYDGLLQYDPQGNLSEVVSYNPNAIKSAIGNEGSFDVYNPELSKAEGGTVNPIKTPRQMMMEMAGLPVQMAEGSTPKKKVAVDVVRSAAKAVKDYRRIYGKNPSPQEMDDLRRAVWESQQVRSPIKSDPVTQARANFLMANDPNYVASSPVTLGGTSITRNFNPDTSPDPFLYQSQFGRKPKGSWLPQETVNIDDPSVRAQIDAAQLSGDLEPGVSSEYFGDMARAIENYALRSGKEPVLDQLKQDFVKKNGRYPDFDETNAMVAEYNVMRHQHGPMGPSVVTKRPGSRTGMQEWVSQARNEGLPESYVSSRPYNYSDRLKAELQIAKGETPARRVRTEEIEQAPEARDRGYHISYDEDGNASLVQNFREGSLALPANQMRADMAVAGYDPYENALEQRRLEQRAKAAKMANKEGLLSKTMRRAMPLMAPGSAGAAAESAREGRPVEAALHGSNAAAALAAMKRKLMRPAVGVMGATAVPMSASDAYKRYQKGDTTGAMISGVETAGNAMQMLPFLPAQIAGTVLGMGAAGVNAYRDTE